MSRIAITLGKFYPFHEGHKALIDFMLEYPLDFDEHFTLVCGKPGDLIPTKVRFEAVRQYNHRNNYDVDYIDDPDMPDYPKDDVDFWEKWVNVIEKNLWKDTDEVYLFTSEVYGEQFAREIQARIPYVKKCVHIPFDPDRTSYSISGSEIRDDFLNMEYAVDKHIINYLTKYVYFVGAESTGKTTTAKRISNRILSSLYVSEYARGYLEMKGARLTPEKFHDIINGQYAQELSSTRSCHLFKFYDTCLITTYGWAKLYYPEIAFYIKKMFDLKAIYTSRNTLFVMMDDDIPFTPDSLRYGVDKRDTTTEYWASILNEFDIPFVMYNREMENKIIDVFNEKGLYNGIS
jgi:NadR type nicotinamide-nucleotide adenylyltransferase